MTDEPTLSCPKCQGTSLVRAGIHKGRQRYRCKDCRATSYGTPAFTSPPPPPCLRCGERTVRGGLTDKGTQTYRCTACHRRFIPPPPFVAKRLPNGRIARCHHCDSDDLVFNGINGTKQGRQRYKCCACEKSTYGFKPRPVKPLPCPYCRAQCRRKGSNQHKRPRYLCTACGKRNTNLFPAPPRGTDGPYRWRRSFCLDMASAAAITTYCNKHILTMSQAIRAILHTAVDKEYATPTLGLRHRTPEGDLRYAVQSAPRRETHVFLPRRLLDLRPQAARERMSRDPEIRHLPLIYIVCEVTVALDDKAYTGLIQTMDRFNLNHQQAVRYLITLTAKPQQTPVSIHARPAY